MNNDPKALKNFNLFLNLVYHLRQVIDLYRVIGLNADALNAREGGKAFFASVQQTSLGEIAVTICKIYEREKGFELNSIPGIIGRLDLSGCSASQLKLIEKFGVKYGNAGAFGDPALFLKATHRGFTRRHKAAFALVLEFRNKYAAHSEVDYAPQKLGAPDTFEELFRYAADFYGLMTEVMFDVVPGSRMIAVNKALDGASTEMEFIMARGSSIRFTGQSHEVMNGSTKMKVLEADLVQTHP